MLHVPISRNRASVFAVGGIISRVQWHVQELLFLFIVFNTHFIMDLRTVNELLAGSVGGAAQVLVGQPLDTIKTRAQVAPSTSIPRHLCGLTRAQSVSYWI